MATRPLVVAFDVLDTLLDLQPLHGRFVEAFGMLPAHHDAEPIMHRLAAAGVRKRESLRLNT